MIIIRMAGRLGNQMFQYALYYSFIRHGKEALLYSDCDIGASEKIQKSSLFEIYPVRADFASDKLASKYIYIRNYRTIILNRIGIRQQYPRWFKENKYGEYDESVLSMTDVFLDGYWQTEKYFVQYESEIKKLYIPQIEISDASKMFLDIISSDDCSVSIHVRLGDYTNKNNLPIYGNICTVEYYKAAIEYIRQRMKSANFYLFSNNIKKSLELLDGYNVIPVDCNDTINGWQDMYLMSHCRYNIIANSTFSWWGAWLNNNEKKIVIAPDMWINTSRMRDVCPQSWIRINRNGVIS